MLLSGPQNGHNVNAIHLDTHLDIHLATPIDLVEDKQFIVQYYS